MHPFDTATHLDLMDDGQFRGHTSPAYANMVGPFGGVTAACMLQAPMKHAQRLGEPIALTVNFASALADGEFTIAARPLRTTRSTQHWSMELSQGGEVAASGTAVFAVRRPTWSATEATPPASVPSPDTLPRTGIVDRLAWTQRYDMRFARGGLPESYNEEEQLDSVSQVWLRDDPPRSLDFVSLASLCDSFFPRVVVRRRKPIPIGTVSLTSYFHADTAMLLAQSDRSVLGAAKALAFRDGYFDQSAELWSDSGQLLASSHQIVYYRD